MSFRLDLSIIFLWIVVSISGKAATSQWLGTSVGNSRTCDKIKEITDAVGEYNLQNDIYEYRDFCLYVWPKEGSTLTISFVDFNFGYEDENGNCTNFVEIGANDYAPDFQKSIYCGSKTPVPFVTNEGFAWIWVHREYTIADAGYNVELHYSTAPKCNGDVLVTSYTFLTSPLFPMLPPPETHCEWSISSHDTASNFPLQIQLTTWSVLGVGAKLQIFDGKGGQLLANLDERTSSESATGVGYTTSGPHAYILFYSNTAGMESRFNATVKVKGYCIPGTLPCGDGTNCYSQEQLCDSHQDCSTGYDELGCDNCAPTQFWCGKDDGSCYNVDQRCNGFKDCPRSMEDELNCKTCGPGSFLCKSDSKCIYERWRCDGDYDCKDRSDELDCDYTASRRVITAAVIGSLVCSLLLVIALGCTCKLYSLRASHHRHPHHQYRATPLTRVERELFQRQAPPTYDMTITGTNSESSTTRAQRQRRRRNRRYQFQRAAPANIGHQCNNDSREDGVEPSNTGGQSTQTTMTDGPEQPSVTTPQQHTNPVANEQSATNSELRQTVASFVLESVPDLLAEMIFAPRQGQPSTTGQSGGSVPVRTSTPIPIETRDSCTQTNLNARNESQNSSPPPTSPTTQTPSTSTNGRQTRSTSASRSRSRRTSSRNSPSSKDQQARPLPKKKRILPVMVQAPCAGVIVEEDTLACVYPCPPSYSQAVATDSPGVDNPATEIQDDGSLSSSVNEPQEQTTDEVFTPHETSLTTTKSRFFPFNLGQALRNITSASFSRFNKNPYLQMETQDPANGAISNGEGRTSIDSNADHTFTPRRQLRPSTSSDESMLECTFDTDSLGPNNELQDMSSSNVTPANNTATPGNYTKVFPQRKTNMNSLSANGNSSNQNSSLDVSDSSPSKEDV